MGAAHFMRTERKAKSLVVNVTNDASTTDLIDIRGFASGMFEVDDADMTALTWYSLSGADGATRVAASDSGGTAITQTVADNKSYAMPAALFGASYILVVGNAAGTLRMDLKS